VALSSASAACAPTAKSSEHSGEQGASTGGRERPLAEAQSVEEQKSVMRSAARAALQHRGARMHRMQTQRLPCDRLAEGREGAKITKDPDKYRHSRSRALTVTRLIGAVCWR